MSMPLFTVVIPTRNRAYLLRYALESALRQTFDDFEIVVSNNDSSDGTEEVIREVGAGQIRYVRTDKTLSMPDHWDFALTHAEGRYVTYLCDDDALHPELLAKVAEALQNERGDLVTWNAAWYFHPTWNVADEKNTLQFRGPFTGDVIEVDSKSDLKAIFSFKYDVRHPKMLNTFCSRKVIEIIRAQLGRVFLPSCPDYTAGAAMLALTDKYFFIDEPLYVAGSARESIGSSTIYQRGEATNTFVAEFGNEDLFARSPLKSSLVTNYVVDSLFRVKEKMESLSDVDVDWPAYFTASYAQLRQLRNRGIDVTEDEAEFFSVLDSQPAQVQERVRETLLEWTRPEEDHRRGAFGQIRKVGRAAISNSALLQRLELTMRPGLKQRVTAAAAQQRWPVIFTGEENGFGNILECLQQLDGLSEGLQARKT